MKFLLNVVEESLQVHVYVPIVASPNHPVVFSVIQGLVVDPGEHHVVELDIPELVELVMFKFTISGEVVVQRSTGTAFLKTAFLPYHAPYCRSHPSCVYEIVGLLFL